MKNTFKTIILALLCTLFILLKSADSQAKNNSEAFDRGLIILASTSLTNAVSELAKNFGISQNISVSVGFEAPTQLATDIENGEAANIFIAEDQQRMKDLQRKGVLNFTMSALISDRLVLVAPKDHMILNRIAKFKTQEEKIKFAAQNSLLVIPDPEVDFAGKLVVESFTNLKIWDKISSKIIKSPNTRSALYLVASGGNIGVMYKSDAVTDPNAEIIAEIPEKYHDKIIYQVAIVTDANATSDVKDSEKFVEYLNTPKAQEILEKHGFTKI